MYKETSEQFNTLITAPGRTFRARLLVGDEVVEGISSIKLSTGSNNGDALTLGSTISQMATITMENPGVSLSGKEFTLQIGLKLDEGNIEYIPIGVFTADKVEVKANKLSTTAYDRMIRLSEGYNSSLPDDTNTVAVLKDIAKQTGVPISTEGLTAISMQKPIGYTCREVLMYISQLYGGFANVNREGTIEIHCWEDSGYWLDADMGINGFSAGENYTVNKITCSTGQDESGNAVVLSSGDGMGISFSNPFMTQEILDEIYSKIQGFTYSPVTCPVILGDPRLDPWDVITIENAAGTTYTVPLMSLEYSYDGGLSMTITSTCTSESENSFDYKGPMQQFEERMTAKIAIVELLTADKASIKELEAAKAQIDVLSAGMITVDNLTAKVAELGYLKTSELEAKVGTFGYLKTTELSAKVATLGYATIEQLDAQSAKITSLETSKLNAKDLVAEVAKLGYLEADNLAAEVATLGYLKVAEAQLTYATINKLDAANANISALQATVATIEKAYISEANVNKLLADYVKTTTLKADYLTAESIKATYATVSNLNAANANISALQTKVGDISTLMFGTASGGSLTTEFSNSVIALIGDATISSAKIISLVADKITSGTINTNKVTVKSDNGRLQITGDTILIKDANRTRVQIGKDANADYNIYILDKTGKVMFDATGIHADAIKSPIIEDAMVSDAANISADKLNIDSLFSEINDSTNTIKSTKIYLDDKKQTLDVAFGTTETKITDINKTVTNQGTAISTIQGQITSKIWKSDITSETKALDEKITAQSNKYNTLSQELSGLKTTVGEHTSQIANKADGSTVTAVSNRVTSVETSLSGFKSEVSSTYTTKQEFDNLTIGGRNLYVGASKWRKDAPATTGTSDDAYLYLSGASAYLEKGKTYTLQAVCDLPWSTAHGSGAGAGKGTIWIASEDRKYHKVFTGDGTTSGRYTWTFVHDGTTGNYNVRVNGYTKATKFWDIKIESGNKATDWTPAPEDTASDIKSLSTAITQTDGKITTNAKSISDLGTRVSTVEQTASSLSVSLQSTDKNVSTAQTTANSAKTAAANAQTTADNAAKTATNFLSYDSSGLQIGNKSSGSWSGYRTQITSSAFNILGESGQTIASYGANKVELGKNSTESEILLCGGLGTMKYGTINLIPYNAYGRFMQLIGGNVALNGDRASLTSQGASSGSYSIVEVTANKVLLESADYATAGDGTPVWAGTKIELLSESREINIVGNTDVTGALSVNGTQVSLADHAHNNYLPLSGGTLTGNLTGKYITGTWLQSTAASNMTSAATKYAVLDGSGWIYYRTAAQVLSDVGAASTGHTHNSLYNSALDETITFLKDGNYGYFRPNTASLVYCGSSAKPWYKVYTERLEVTKNRPTMQPVYDNTVSYATNCYISSAGLLSRTTNTSSRTIKHDVKAIKSEDIAPERLYDINVYQFKYNDDIITDKTDARYGKDLPGFIIEELNEVYPIAVDRPTDDVKEWSWNAQYLIPGMLKLIQDQHKADERIEQKIREQEARIGQLTYQMQQLFDLVARQQKQLENLAQ